MCEGLTHKKRNNKSIDQTVYALIVLKDLICGLRLWFDSLMRLGYYYITLVMTVLSVLRGQMLKHRWNLPLRRRIRQCPEGGWAK